MKFKIFYCGESNFLIGEMCCMLLNGGIVVIYVQFKIYILMDLINNNFNKKEYIISSI